MSVPSHAARLQALLAERILLLDGAMGTMIQHARLAEEDYRGQRFRDWGRERKGKSMVACKTEAMENKGVHSKEQQRRQGGEIEKNEGHSPHEDETLRKDARWGYWSSDSA